MAQLTIRLVSNAKSGKRDIIIDHESERDALPFEHEQEHRDLIEKLLGQGILQPGEVGEVIIQRIRPGQADAPVPGEQPGERTRTAHGEGDP
ncbi:MAG: hypothetical protein H0U74_19580 [Bradymonadaceae bacterium]|nr:hypothetical protein [Lujinxingiaceae bacterium]